MSLILSLVVALIVIGLIFWCVRMLVPALGIPEPIGTIITVILVVLVVLWVLSQLTGSGGGLSLPSLRR